jgi:predicted glycogen debranching enzyme
MNTLRLGRDALGSLEASAGREWLVTNGLGGYAAGSVAGLNTRRYHGLLVAALRPPVERTVMVAQLDVAIVSDGRRVALGTNEYGDGTVAPEGWRNLVEFRLEGTLPVWRWSAGGCTIERRLWMAHGANTTYVEHTLVDGPGPVDIELVPLCAYRDYHWHQRGPAVYQVAPHEQRVRVEAYAGAHPYEVAIDHGRFDPAPDWHWGFRHRLESERGLDDGEDLFRPGVFRSTLHPGESVTLVMTAEPDTVEPLAHPREREIAREQALLSRAATGRNGAVPEWVERLALAADQFVVERRDAAGQPLGHTVIAGYPWFADWGRDTMIALPGLTLATGRPELAASCLRTFAHFVSEGMLPNRFPDAGDAPEYNTVDATLWYFVAVDAYWRQTGDCALLADLYPVLEDILHWHARGTRYGIGEDPADGLLRAGVPGVQLTWMDAKVGEWVVTPRIGKPVEINALWFNALSAMREMAVALGRGDDAARYLAQTERVARAFNDRFWNATRDCLYDVIDGDEGRPDDRGRRHDATLRPNQIFAVSLPYPLLDAERARAVVEACAASLWTPVGLRSLDPGDRAYTGAYRGGPLQRDGAYHQGTVWSWLAGPYALAHYRAFGDAAHARRLLAGLGDHLREACIGQISEIFDGDAPHAPRGCFAQAWSVAETLRAWRELDECENEKRPAPAPRRRARKVAS